MAHNDYRERPQTGTTPEAHAAHRRPAAVDPRVLTDDRGNPDLLGFEATWGHRMLAGLGFAMIVVAAVLIIYCAIRVANFAPLAMGEGGVVTFGLVLYGIGLAAGVLVIPPAIVALWVSRRPSHAGIAVVLAIVALVLVAAFIGYALFTGAALVTVLLYGLLFALLPVLYLIAALKVKRSLPDERL